MAKRMIQNSTSRIALATAAILMIPLLGRWPWGLGDYVVMGAMLILTGLLLNLVMSKAGKYKVIGAVVIIGLFLWLWVELAVGLITNWGS